MNLRAALLACALLLPGFARAATPQEALRTMLAADFAGHARGRFGLVVYTAGHKGSPYDCDCGTACGGAPCEVYWLDADALEVATGWKIEPGAARLPNGDVRLTARFVVVAESVSFGAADATHAGRALVALRPARVEEIAYVLRRGALGWQIVNPPMPHVGLAALRDFTAHDLEQLGELGAATQDLPALKRWTAGELAVLNQIHEGGPT